MILLRAVRRAIRSARTLLPSSSGGACCLCSPSLRMPSRSRRYSTRATGSRSDTVSVVQFGAALQRKFAFRLGSVHKIVGMQLPAQLQKFLFECVHFDPELARQLEEREIIRSAGDLLEFSAGRAEVRAERAFVAAPANQRRGRAGMGVLILLDIRESSIANSPRHKKSGWRVRLPTTCRTRLLNSPAETETKAQTSKQIQS